MIPVVFLHGIGGGARSFAPQIASFAAAGYQPVALDLPGYGARAPVDAMSFEALAADVEATHRAERGSTGRCWSATRWAAWWCRPCCAGGRTATAPPCSPAPSPAFGNPAGDFQKKFVADRLAPLDAGKHHGGRSRRDAADGIDGAGRRSGRARAVHRGIRGGAGSDLSRGGATASSRSTSAPTCRTSRCRCSASRPSTTATRRRRDGEDGGEDSRRPLFLPARRRPHAEPGGAGGLRRRDLQLPAIMRSPHSLTGCGA